MTISSQTHQELPYAIQRIIRRLKPHLRDAMAKAIQTRLDEANSLGRTLSAEEIAGCAFEIVLGDGDYDKHMEKMCIEAYDGGKSTPLQEVIDELASRVTRPATVSYR